MKIMVLGIRGMPNVQGGVETHAEHLYRRVAELGCDVEVIVRTPFVPREQKSLGKIRLTRIWAPRKGGLEALVHSFLGVLYAGVSRPDILHIHAIGPAIVTPLARLMGLKVVVTHHGPDYDRDKWGGFARAVLRLGERYGMKYSNARIAISRVIVDLVRARYGANSDLIPNGVVRPTPSTSVSHLQPFGLESRKYFLQVSRLVPEKRQLDLIRAFKAARCPDWKLALVGGLDKSAYCREIRDESRGCDNIVLAGFQSGEALGQFYSHAGVFVLPSSHEGLPIAMLEAMSYGLPVVASDIPANVEVGLPAESYFAMGNVQSLSSRLEEFSRHPFDEVTREATRQSVVARYDWQTIAVDTVKLYRRLLA